MVKKLGLLIAFLLICSCDEGRQEHLGSLRTEVSSQLELLDSAKYYSTDNGHEVNQLETVYGRLKQAGCKHFVFYAGDSSLDNKHWVKETASAINGYEKILTPPIMRMDVDYWMNKLFANQKGSQKICSIMTAVEGSTLGQREKALLEQDIFIKNHLSKDDYLIVSIGGNDVALNPNEKTSKALQMLKNNPNDQQAIKHLISIASERTKKYVEKLIENNTPKKILIAMIYYPDEANTSSWADRTLNLMGYSANPRNLQRLIDLLYTNGTTEIRLKNTTVVPIELSNALDGKTSTDYVQRVEPSAQGGQKMARLFLGKLFPREE